MVTTSISRGSIVSGHPDTLHPGGKYFIQIHQHNGNLTFYFPVQFVAYTSCPGVVVVEMETGIKLRVERKDVFVCN